MLASQVERQPIEVSDLRCFMSIILHLLFLMGCVHIFSMRDPLYADTRIHGYPIASGNMWN